MADERRLSVHRHWLMALLITLIISPSAAARAETGSQNLADTTRQLERLEKEGGTGSPATDEIRRILTRLLDMAEYGKAIRACRLLFRSAPLAGDDNLLCARPLLARGELERARELLDAYLASQPLRAADRAVEIAGVLEGVARYAAAAEYLTSGLASDPGNGDIAIRLVHDLLRAGKTNEAGETALAASTGVKTTRRDFIRQACLLLVAFKVTVETRNLSALLVEAPGFDESDLDAAITSSRFLKDRELARQAVAKFIASAGDDRDRRAGFTRTASVLLERHGLSVHAVRLVEKAIESGDLNTADDLFRLGHLNVQCQEFEEADAAFSRYLSRTDVDPSKAAIRVGDRWIESGDPKRASLVLSGHGDPGDGTKALALGRALHAAGDELGEWESYEQSAKIVRTPVGFWLEAGSQLAGRRNPDWAAEAFRHALELSNGDPAATSLAHVGLAESMLRMDQISESDVERELLAALKWSGGNGDVVDRVHQVAARISPSGTLTVALMEAAVAREPGKPDLWTRLAESYLATGRGGRAVAAMRRGIEASEDRQSALLNGFRALLDQGGRVEALQLLRELEGSIHDLNPSLYETAGKICLSRRDRDCAARYLGLYLQSPLVMTYDYRGLGDALTRVRLWDLAEKALALARKVMPVEGQWELELSMGRFELERNRPDRAQRAFQKAYRDSPQQRKTLVRIARDFETRGRLDESARWYAKALDDPEQAFRAQVFPVLGNVLWRLGRDQDLKQALATVGAWAFRAFSPLRIAALQMAAAGLLEEAVGLVAEVRGLLPENEQAMALDLHDSLMLRMGLTQQVFRRAQKYCADGEGATDDRACIVAARRLSGRMRPDLAVALLKARTARKDASNEVRLELATVLLVTGSTADALAVLTKTLETLESADVLVNALGPALLVDGTAPAYLGLLQQLLGRGERLSSDPILLLETARALLFLNRSKEAAVYLERYVAAVPGGVASAYRKLAFHGDRDRARSVIRDSGPETISVIQASDLRDIGLDLLRSGYREEALDLLKSYRKGNQGIEAADETLGRVYQEIGWLDRSLDAFGRVQVARLSTQGRMAYLKALLGSRDLEGALGLAMELIRLAEGKGDEEAFKGAAMILELLMAEGASGLAATVALGMGKRDSLPAPTRLRLSMALARRGEEGDGSPARDEFLAAVGTLDRLPGEAAEFLRHTVGQGDPASLLDALKGLKSTPAVLEAAESLSCLESIHRGLWQERDPGPDPFPADLSALSRSAFRCGRWDRAYKLARRSLGHLQPLPVMESLVEIGTVSALLSGKSDVVKEVMETLSHTTQDQVLQRHLEGVSRMVHGDYQGLSRLFVEMSHLNPMDPGRQLAAVEGAIWDGDAEVLEQTRIQALKHAEIHRDTALAVAGLYRRSLREDLEESVLEPVGTIFPGDHVIAWRRLEAALMSGNLPRSRALASTYTDRFGSSAKTLADLVGAAAGQLAVPLVDEYLEKLQLEPPSEPGARAMLQAGLLFLRVGREQDGFEWVRKGYGIARDRREFLSTLAYATLVDPDAPVSLLRGLLGRNSDALEMAHALPLVIAARCMDTVQTKRDVQRCAGVILDEQRYLGLSIILGSARKALLTDRPEVAFHLLESAADTDGTFSVGRRILDIIVSVAWPARNMKPDLAARFGHLGLSILENRTMDSHSIHMAPYRAHVVDLTGKADHGAGVYEKLIASSPAHAGLRNNLAYLLSIRGGDLDRAVSEVRIARVLASRSSSFYLETEAWTEFARHDTTRALELQQASRRLWSIDQGGGLAESFYHLGRIQEALGRKAAARESYRRAFVLEPLEKPGHSALSRWNVLSGETNREAH